MNTTNTIIIIVIFLLVVASAFFSSAETAYTMVNKVKLRSLVDNNHKGAALVISLLNKSSSLLSTILVGNNIVNIAVSSLATTWTLEVFGPAATGFSTAILTVVLLIFGEVTPKTIASKHAESIAIAYAPVIKVLTIVLLPIVFLINGLSHLVLRIFKSDTKNLSTAMTQEELRTIVEISHEAGVIEKGEKQIINNLFNFVDSKAKDVMIPRIDMNTISISASASEILSLYKECGHSRIPVYKDSQDNIVGILHSKDLLLSDAFRNSEDNSFNIERLMRKPYFTFEAINTSTLFKDMQLKSTSVAIVIDEYGALAGMITTGDLVEEIIGEMHDEHDTKDDIPFIELSNNKFKVSGSYKLDDINSKLETNLTSEENDSIGGLIIEQLDRFPRAGDAITTDKIKATVIKTANKRIESVLIEFI